MPCKDPAAKAAYDRAYRETHRTEKHAYDAAYRIEHADEIKARRVALHEASLRCRSCEFQVPLGQGGLCQACFDWACGKRTLTGDGSVTMLAAIGIRAHHDQGVSAGRMICEYCGRPNRECGSEYEDMVRDLRRQADGDPGIVFQALAQYHADDIAAGMIR